MPTISAAFDNIWLIHVAEGNDLDRRHLHQSEQIALAIPAAADQPHPPLFIAVVFLCLAEGRSGQAESTGLKEFASVHRPYKDIRGGGSCLRTNLDAML